jgi:hypothetical protein
MVEATATAAAAAVDLDTRDLHILYYKPSICNIPLFSAILLLYKSE